MTEIQTTLGEFGDVIMGMSPKGSTYNQIGSGFPLLNGPTEFGDSHPEPVLFTTDSKRESKVDDLIFCVRGSTTGRMNWSDQVYSLGRGVCAIRGSDAIDTKYIKYVLDHRLQELLAVAGGGTFPNLKKDDIRSFKIPLHPSHRKIVGILSKYDDLIENNLKRIKLLEEAAQHLYKEWFVNFRFPGSENTPLNKDTGLPVGFDKKEINGLAKYFGRGITPKYQSGSKIFGINQKANKGTFLEKKHFKEYDPDLIVPEKKYACFGDVLINCLGEGTIGRVHFYTGENSIHPVDQHMTIYRSDDLAVNFIVFQFLASAEGQGLLSSLKKGGTNMTMLNIGDLRQLSIPLPEKHLRDMHWVLGKKMALQKKNLVATIESLKEARDLLLPRLMNRTIEI